jgi:hypothetical protein
VRNLNVNKSLLVIAGLSLLPGCPLLEAEVQVQEVCITYDDIDALPATDVHQQIVIDDMSEIHELTDHAEDLRFRRAEVIATSGIDNFDFVDTARIAISPGAGESPVAPLTLYRCDGDCVSHADSLALTADEEHDVLDYLRGDAITLHLDVTGTPPPVAWTMSVVVCFEGRARFEVAP